MKLVINSAEGEAYFALVEQCGIADLKIVRTQTPDEALAAIVDADAFYGFPNSELYRAARSLRWIQSPGAGVDWVARVEGLSDSDVIVTNTRGAHAPSIAEHVFSLLLAFTRNIPQMVTWKELKHWGWAESYKSLTEIKGSTIGIIGYGAIGQAIAKRADAFEMSILAVDVNANSDAPYVDSIWPLDQMHKMLDQSDIVVIAAPYTAETYHMFDSNAFANMKPGAYLIAISRGGIVEESALLDSLVSGKIAGAGIDVTETEPLPEDSPLWTAPNLIITPHAAGSSTQKERRCVEILCENLVHFAAGEPMKNVVDKKRGY